MILAPSKLVKIAVTSLLSGMVGIGAVGCSGDDDGEGGSDKNSTSDSDSAIGAGLQEETKLTNASLDANSNGGSVELTQEEIDSIQTAACTGWAAEGESLPAVIQLVVDISSSMRAAAPGTDRSRWDVTQEALKEAVAALPPSVALGVFYYPNKVAVVGGPIAPSNCINEDALIPITPLTPEHQALVQNSLDTAEINRLTPTHDAYSHALNAGLLKYSSSDRFMLLITDGAPTVSKGCIEETSPTAPIVADIKAALEDHGVRTFIIGSPGSEISLEIGNADMRPWLSEAAVVGGTSTEGCQIEGPNFCHFDMTQETNFATALRAGLSEIVGQIVDSCAFEVPAAPAGKTVDPNLTNLIVTWGDGGSTLILPDADGDCSEGWQFNSDGKIELCAASCDRLKLDHLAQIQLHFGCGSEIVPVR